MIKAGTINPLNVFALRKVAHCPLHFEKVYFDLRVDLSDIINWIEENLEGRYHIGQHYKESSGGNSLQYIAAFEHHAEASYFAIMQYQINK